MLDTVWGRCDTRRFGSWLYFIGVFYIISGNSEDQIQDLSNSKLVR